MSRRIEPARVVLDASGAPFNERYGDVYSTRDGALAQARHVFLRGSGLPARWCGRAQFVIVETGFGLGVNFFAAWQAWRDDPARPQRLHFVSVERHPVDATTLLRFAPAEVAPLARQLAAVWPLALAGLHRREFEQGAVTLTLAFGDIECVMPQLVAGADAFFLDGFAPERNPQMWSPRVMKALAHLARHGATVATWSTARPVRESLAANGFDVSLAPGFGHKRQMLCASFAPRWRVRRYEPLASFDGERSALVFGAGLAGASAAWALARRGWRVQVFDRAPHVAAGASNLPWGLLHPQITADDNDMARLVRAGGFAAQAMLTRIAPEGQWREAPLWRSRGVFVQAREAQEAARWQALNKTLDLPAEFARFCTADEAAARAGVQPRAGGWWFASGASVAAAAFCSALIEHAGVGVRTRCALERLQRQDGRWIAQDANGTTLGAAPVCIVATALDAPRLLRLDHAPVRSVRGRLSRVEAPALASLEAEISGGATLVRIAPTTFWVGATYEFDSGGVATHDATERAHAGNLQRLARLLAFPVEATPVGIFEATRCVARDRLPLAGAVADEAAALHAKTTLRGAHLADLPRQTGLYASFAFGSRGLALAPLAAEWIAAQIEGEPWMLERDLAARFDVARFLLEAVRRGGGGASRALRPPP